MTWDEFVDWYNEYCFVSPRTPSWMAEVAKRSTESGTPMTSRNVLEGWHRSLQPRMAWAVRRATEQLAQEGVLHELHPDRHLGAIIARAKEIEERQTFGRASDSYWDDYSCDLCHGLGIVVIDKNYPDGKVYQASVACVCERGNNPGFPGLRRLRKGDVFAGTEVAFEG
jgi:hypothetical protein